MAKPILESGITDGMILAVKETPASLEDIRNRFKKLNDGKVSSPSEALYDSKLEDFYSEKLRKMMTDMIAEQDRDKHMAVHLCNLVFAMSTSIPTALISVAQSNNKIEEGIQMMLDVKDSIHHIIDQGFTDSVRAIMNVDDIIDDLNNGIIDEDAARRILDVEMEKLKSGKKQT